MTQNHRNRSWQTRWALDVPARTATHNTGLIVLFTRDAEGWRGEAQNAQQIYDALLPRNGPHNTPKMLSRLMREAGEIWGNYD